MIHEGDVWSPYKRTRAHNQEGRANKRARSTQGSEVDLDKEG
jgi:hypothetical protein